MAKNLASSKKFVPTDAQKREMGWQVEYNVDQFSYCCGGREVGNISVYQKHRWYETYSGGWSYTATTDKREWKENTKLSQTPKEAYQEMLKEVREQYPQYPLMINLLPSEHGALKALLEEDSDARMIHTWRNPNTDNLIEMWVLENNSDMEYRSNGVNDD